MNPNPSQPRKDEYTTANQPLTLPKIESTLNKDLVKNFAGTRLMGNFSLKRSQWKNAGHALSSEMHEFAVDWIVLTL
jgi:hypothetical protein